MAGSSPPRPGVRRHPDGRVLQHLDRRASRPSATAAAYRARRATRSPRSPSCSARPSARCSCSAPTSGPTAPRRPRCASSRTPACPTITNGMGRGIVPGGHPLLVTKARGAAFGGADLVVVVGTPAGLPARLRRLRRARRAPPRPASCTSPTPPARSRATPTSRRRPPATSRLVLDGVRDGVQALVRRPDWSSWVARAPGHRRKAVTARRRPARRRRPTRSTPPASTASWSPGWPRTPS